MIEIIKFQIEHIDDAAKLFSSNYSLLRKTLPELPEKYQDINAITGMLQKILTKNSGVMAISKEKVVGYLTGLANIPHFKGNADGVYIPEWAHSATVESRELIYHKLYRTMAEEWVSERCYTHAITFFAVDSPFKEQFNSLGFGMQVIDGLRSMDEILVKKTSADIQFREAVSGDLPALEVLARKLTDHLNVAPIFLNRKYNSTEELKKAFFGDNVVTFIAQQDGRLVSCIRALRHQGSSCDIVQDVGTLGINFGFTLPEMQGKGVATGVLNELIGWGRKNGMKRCSVVFESINREAVNFWLRHFKPVCYSMIRKVDDRVND